MIQAARSGRQNIAEGSRAAATSSQTELRLINVARASLEELLLDYEDFLRHRKLAQWAPNGEEAQAVRALATTPTRDAQKTNPTDMTDPNDVINPTDQSDPSDPTNFAVEYATYTLWLDNPNPAVRANALICLIHQANYLLDKQIQALEHAFVNDGGYSEHLASARLNARTQKNKSHPSGDAFPACPKCGGAMVLRTAKQGKEAGRQFFGCSGYPECKGIMNL
jgi:four helix bundle suffix protein